MKCLKPVLITKNLDSIKFPMGLRIPCGQCMNCRIQKREEWVMRMLHEFKYWEYSIFVTLTYDENNLPKNEFNESTLKKSDLQKFFKRLRKNSNRKMLYFACGEYGEETGRPHYHCIIFGFDYLNDYDLELIKASWKKCKWNELKLKPFGDVNETSLRYVVSYLEKTITGKLEKYAYDNIETPFHIVSKGIGKNYAIDNKDKLQSDGFCQMSGFKKAIPRYYVNKTNINREDCKKESIRKEVDTVMQITGMKLNRDDLYLLGSTDDTILVEDTLKKSNKQHDLNLRARLRIKSSRKN
jgi:hypothetical protein